MTAIDRLPDYQAKHAIVAEAPGLQNFTLNGPWNRGHNTVETKLFSTPDYVFLEVDNPRRPVDSVENP